MAGAAAFSALASREPPRVAEATALFGGVSAEALAARARAAIANFIVARVLQLSEPRPRVGELECQLTLGIAEFKLPQMIVGS